MRERRGNAKLTGAGQTRWDLTAAFVKGVSLIVLATALLAQATSLASGPLLPGFRAPLLNEPAPASDFRSKVGQGPSGPGPGTSDPEIQELARGLRYNPGLMYKFVHDHIRFYPVWGDVKGPYMTWMDRSGNGFDQASLMIALLKEAAEHGTEYTITDPNYVVGEIELSATEAFEWLDIVDDANTARMVLARAGLYGSVSEDEQGDITALRLEHVWVKVKINGQTYEFDPSYKSHTRKISLLPQQLEQAMGYVRSEFLDDAQEGTTTGYPSWVKDVNRPNIQSDLASYSTNLINYIKTNYPASDLAEIIGGRSITPVAESALPPTSLPYTVVSRDDEFDVNGVPNLYRTSLRIQHCGIDQTFFSSDIYGRRLTLRYNASNQPELVLDGTPKATGNTVTLGQVYDLTLSVDHPYNVNDFDGTTTLKVKAGGFYQIVNGWGDTGTKILEKHRGLLQQYRHGLADDSEEVLGESFALVGLTWLAQTSRMRSMAHEVGGAAAVIGHHMLGVTGQYAAPYIDMAAGHLGIVAYEDGEQEAMFLAVSGHASAYEHEVIRQLQDCNAVSTVELLEMANDRTTYDKVYAADDGNWSTIQSQLQGYSQEEKDQVSAYVDANYTVYLPQYGDLDQDDWTGTGFQALLFTEDCLTAGYVITGGYSGGCATNNSNLSPSEVVERSYRSDDGHAAYNFSGTDLTIGNGGYPFGLSFGRQYSSHRRLEDGPLGLGWTHNLDVTALIRSDSFQALGEDCPVDAATHIVTLYVTWDILKDDYQYLTKNMIASLSQTWLMDQMMDNLVTIEQGGATTKFVKDPNGVYCPPPGQALKLVVQQDDTFRLKNNQGIFLDFDSDGRISQWSDAHGNVVEFFYSDDKLTDVVSRIGGSTASRSLSLLYSGDHISSVTDSASRSASFSYDGNGNLTGYTNPDGNDTTYQYDDVNDGQLTKTFSPVDQVNPLVTIVYDSLGRMKRRIGGDNCCTYDYYFADYRAEVLEPAQTDPNNVTKRFSTIRWVNEENRTIITKDQLGRETTSTYDGQLQVDLVVMASGMSAEYAYDENHNVTQADSIVKPSSSDPNTCQKYGYDSYVNSEGRWFTPRTTYNDPCDYETTYEYDPNVGTLLKITYPAIDPPGDMNRPVVQFSYNAYGQLESKTDANGMVTKYDYYLAADGAGLKKTIVDYGSMNLTTEYTYDDVGNVATVKDPRGNVTQSEYYASRLLKKTVAPTPFSYETTYEYYADGKLKHVKQQTSEEGLIYLQSITYNARRQKETVRGPYADGNDVGVNLTTYTYDALGRVWKVTDAEGNVTETRYYPDGKVWKVIDGEGHATVTNTYNPDGSLHKVQDAKGNTTEYEYNGFMGTKKTIYADGTYTEPGYDGIRRLETMQTRAGQIISIGYDGLHRVKTKALKTKTDVSPYNTITYKYDVTGRVVKTTDNTGTIENTYDSAGRLIKVQYPGDREISYQYDAAGNRTKLTYPDGSFITYEYDQLNRLTKIRNDANAVLAEYSYDSRSRRDELTYANGRSIQYQYDAASRLLYIANQTGSPWHEYGYRYDKVGKRLSMLVNETDEHVYSYDKIYQITDVNYPEGYEYLASDTTFNYDAAGNRSSVINGGTANYVSNELNQYDSVGNAWYDYDENGNLTCDDIGFYNYDAENRLIKVTNASGSVHGLFNPALDNFDLTFTTAGDANWVATTAEYYHDPNSDRDSYQDSARNGQVSGGQQSLLETTVSGKGTIKFYYKRSPGTSDSFTFKVDNQTPINLWIGEEEWTQYSYTITALGPHTLQWRYQSWSTSPGDGGVWVDYVEWNNESTLAMGLQQALDTGWPVLYGYPYTWSDTSTGSYHDGDCARSGSSIPHGQTCQMEAMVEGEGTVTFYWKVSSQENHDFLQFYIDGVLKDQISGSVSWQQKSYNLSGSGSHSLLWQYVKDGSGSSGDDCGWVDWLQGPGSSPPEPDPLGQALDSDLSFTTGGDGSWYPVSGSWNPYYYDYDSAMSGYMEDDQESWMQTTVNVNGQETVTFYWRVSSEAYHDYLEFYIDGVFKDQISGELDWRKKSYTITGSGSHTLKWRYVKDENGSEGQDCGWVDALSLGPNPLSPPPNDLSEALDSDLFFTTSGNGGWSLQSHETCKYYYDHDAAQSYGVGHNQKAWLQTLVDVNDQETVTFYWKVISEQGGDYLQFYIDGVLKDQISGYVDWQRKSYTVTGSGTHVLQWCYTKNGSVSEWYDCGWVDYVQWTGLSPRHDPSNWDIITYKYDPSGRRIKKKVDGYTTGYMGCWQIEKKVNGYTTTYLYDGDHIIAEYDGNNNLVRKYVYGPRVDEPVCMIDRADSNAVYYYHFDGLGSVVALTDANGTCVQTYEYTVYGHVAASDPNHPNPFMFTGRQFDIETGLYYYRARYYNPYIGRFLQTDPVGYGDGMNLYRYCMNNPLNVVDPSGLCCDSNDVNDVNDVNDSNDCGCSLYDVTDLDDLGRSPIPASSSFLMKEPVSGMLCMACVAAAALSCGVVCAEDPTWDDPKDTRFTCTNKCLRTALGLYGEPPKNVVVRVFSISCKTVCGCWGLGKAGGKVPYRRVPWIHI